MIDALLVGSLLGKDVLRERVRTLRLEIEHPSRPRKLVTRPKSTPKALWRSMQRDMNRGPTQEELEKDRRGLRVLLKEAERQLLGEHA